MCVCIHSNTHTHTHENLQNEKLGWNMFCIELNKKFLCQWKKQRILHFSNTLLFFIMFLLF